jgi:ubiquinone/menaquinone biosynthesis C-methylase UbiE
VRRGNVASTRFSGSVAARSTTVPGWQRQPPLDRSRFVHHRLATFKNRLTRTRNPAPAAPREALRRLCRHGLLGTLPGVTNWDSTRTASEHDAMAVEYDQHNASSAANRYYERPATIALLGDVYSKRVLEVGCGSGPVTEWLVDHGAAVVACDVSVAMLELARSRIGDGAELHHHDLAEPLTFLEDASVDLVVASLVFHYVRDWVAPLRELHRVLRPTGSVVMSIHHPAWDWRNHCPEDYFAFLQVSEVWVKPHTVTFWRRPLTAATDAISAAGFVIDRLVEATPDPQLEIQDPRAFDELTTGPFFLHLRLRPAQPDGSVAGFGRTSS